MPTSELKPSKTNMVSADLSDPKVLARQLGLLVPSDEQCKVVSAPPFIEVDGEVQPAPLLVVAGAGAGKTKTLALRAAYSSLHFDVPFESILGLTFTRKAAGGLEQELRKTLAALQELDPRVDTEEYANHSSMILGGSAEAMTYNAFALGVVREFGTRIGIDPQVPHMGEAAAWQLMSDIVEQWQGDLDDSFVLSTVIDRALLLRQDIANQAMTVPEARRGIQRLLDQFESAKSEGKKSYVAFHKEGEEALRKRLQLLDIIEEFDSRMNQMGRMDYAQQMSVAIRVVEELPDAREILRERHKIVFLDEFQDTSVAQMRFLSALFGDHAVTAVGDPNQAIYGWRGASAASLSDFHLFFNKNKDVPNRTLTLTTAWRNDRRILEVANEVSKPLRSRPSWKPSVAGKAEEHEEVLPELELRPDGADGIVKASYAKSERQALDEIVSFIRKSIEQVESTRSEKGEASVAVLSRRARPLLDVVAALRAAGIPAQLAAGEALLMSAPVMDLRAALEITADIGRSSQLLRLVTNLHLGALDLRILGDFAKRLDREVNSTSEQSGLYLEAIEAVTRGRVPDGLSQSAVLRITSLGRRLKSIRDLRDSGLTEQIEAARWILGLDAESMSDPTSPGGSELLDQFTQLAEEYESSTEQADLTSFLRWLDAVEARENGLRVPSVQIEPGAVQAMTIHSSKGLEWDIVVVMDMEDGRFPSSRRLGPIPTEEPFAPEPFPDFASQKGWWSTLGSLPYTLRKDRDHLPELAVLDMSQTGGNLESQFKEDVGMYLGSEERRLAYVALTRAKSHLFLSGAWMTGGKRMRRPSVFLTEAAAVEGIDISLQSSPNLEEADALLAATESVSFPPEPTLAERRAEQVAARVKDSQKYLLTRSGILTGNQKDIVTGSFSKTESVRDEVLAGLPDRQLAARIQSLIREWKEVNATHPDTATALSPDEAVRQLGRTRSLAVTEIARIDSDPNEAISDMLRPVPAPPREQQLVGIVFHSWVENYVKKLAASSSEEPEDVEYVGGEEALSDSDREYLDQLKNAFIQSELTDLFEVEALESPFSTVRDGTIIRGRIDAVLRDSDGDVWLIDWKTRRTLPNRIDTKNLLYYRSQLRQYQESWKLRSSEDNASVHPALAFVTPKGVRIMSLVEIEDALADSDSDPSA